jgi:hypothetical protein
LTTTERVYDRCMTACTGGFIMVTNR